MRSLTADRGATVKTVWRLFDGALVESVLMRYPNRVTVCISSQAGCGMNCPFCATGQAGLTRNLSTAEIVEQVVSAACARGAALAAGRGRRAGRRGRRLRRGGGRRPDRVSNVVFMGMGEPLANYTAAHRRRSAGSPTRRPSGWASRRAASRCRRSDWCPAIDRLAAEGLPVTLALSLHAPDDELRDELVPINTRWTVDEALDAAHRYFDATGRRVSIEYALIRDINDHAWRADLLGEKLTARGRGWVHVNPIPLNPTPGSKWTAREPRGRAAVRRAAARPRHPDDGPRHPGPDIDGACGQLAASTA